MKSSILMNADEGTKSVFINGFVRRMFEMHFMSRNSSESNILVLWFEEQI